MYRCKQGRKCMFLNHGGTPGTAVAMAPLWCESRLRVEASQPDETLRKHKYPCVYTFQSDGLLSSIISQFYKSPSLDSYTHNSFPSLSKSLGTAIVFCSLFPFLPLPLSPLAFLHYSFVISTKNNDVGGPGEFLK